MRQQKKITDKRNKIQTNVGADDSVRPYFEGITKKHGITLVSLVITIVIMLILAGVMISIITDEDDVFDMAENATAQWNNRVTTEDNAMKNLLAKRNEILGETTTEPTTPPETPPTEVEVTLTSSNGDVNSVMELEVDATLVLTASLNVTATQDIVWTSSDDTVATVAGSGTNNNIGTITGVSAGGPVTITATYDGKTASCNVVVKEEDVSLVLISIEGKTYYAEECMDLNDWTKSQYNTGGYKVIKESGGLTGDDYYLYTSDNAPLYDSATGNKVYAYIQLIFGGEVWVR